MMDFWGLRMTGWRAVGLSEGAVGVLCWHFLSSQLPRWSDSALEAGK